MTPPYRYTKEQFDRWAPLIGQALQSYPSPAVFDPTPLSPVVLVNRLRECRKAKKQFGHTHPAIDEALFTRRADELIIREENGMVVVGPRIQVQAHAAIAATVKKSSDVQVAESDVALVCTLLHHRALSPCPSFYVIGLTEETIKQLEHTYDVAFVRDEHQHDKHRII